jgi:hypothetical protein
MKGSHTTNLRYQYPNNRSTSEDLYVWGTVIEKEALGILPAVSGFILGINYKLVARFSNQLLSVCATNCIVCSVRFPIKHPGAVRPMQRKTMRFNLHI